MIDEHVAQQTFAQAIFSGNVDALEPWIQPIGTWDVAEGFFAYRGNYIANQERAMQQLYPMVLRCLGEEDFAALVRLYLNDHPPTVGDWAQYGGDFAVWIGATNPGGMFATIPWIVDVATWDAAIHQCESGSASTLDSGSLSLLGEDPETVRLVLSPNLHLIQSDWDIAALFANNTISGGEPNALENLQHWVIYRDGWKAVHASLPAASACMLSSGSLSNVVAKAQAIDPSFDVMAWLAQAIGAQWIGGVSVLQ